MLTDEAEWRPGYEKLYVGIDPQKVHMELYEVGEAPTPQEIVDYARDSSTELHKCFQWDDTIAAEQWRKQQARLLQYHIVVKEPDRPKDRPPVRLRYVEKGGRGYKSIIRSVKDEDSYEKILARAYAELAAFKEKYKMLRELPDMLAEMIELIRKDEAQDE